MSKKEISPVIPVQENNGNTDAVLWIEILKIIWEKCSTEVYAAL